MNKYFSLAVSMLFTCLPTIAQRHFYHRLDIGSSNIYTFVLSNLVTGYANYLSHDMLFDNSYLYTVYNGDIEGEKISTKGYNPIGITMRDLFNDAIGGVKLGYQSDLTGAFNWGIYASGHYRINQEKVRFPQQNFYGRERFQYIKPGVGLIFTFGNVEKNVKIIVEGAVRYDFSVGYKGYWAATGKNVLNRGLSSHYSAKVAGRVWFSAGVFADVNHYKLYKNMGSNSHFKPCSFGAVFTITPARGEYIHD